MNLPVSPVTRAELAGSCSAPTQTPISPDQVSGTVTRWANTGRLTCLRTLGGTRRYREDEILAVLNGTRAGGAEQESRS